MPNMEQVCFSTGSTLLDLILGGGWAQGKLINIVGDSAVGKSLLAIEAAANFAHRHPKGRIAYVESESAFSEAYAEVVGFPAQGEVISAGSDVATTIEGFVDWMLEDVLKKRRPSLVVLDSLDAIGDKDSVERRASDKATYGMGKAKVLSGQLGRLVGPMEQGKVTLIIVSQTRENIAATFGAKQKRSGGRALQFFCSQVVWLHNGGRLKRTARKEERVYGVKIKAEVTKNRIAPPFRKCDMELHFAYGIEDLVSCWNYLDGKRDRLKSLESKRELAALVNGEQGDDAYNDMLEVYQDTVRELWQDAETDFAPKRRKYGGKARS